MSFPIEVEVLDIYGIEWESSCNQSDCVAWVLQISSKLLRAEILRHSIQFNGKWQNLFNAGAVVIIYG